MISFVWEIPSPATNPADELWFSYFSVLIIRISLRKWRRLLVGLNPLRWTFNDKSISSGVMLFSGAPTHHLQSVWTVTIALLKDTSQHSPALTDCGGFAHSFNTVFVISFHLGIYFGFVRSSFYCTAANQHTLTVSPLLVSVFFCPFLISLSHIFYKLPWSTLRSPLHHSRLLRLWFTEISRLAMLAWLRKYGIGSDPWRGGGGGGGSSSKSLFFSINQAIF